MKTKLLPLFLILGMAGYAQINFKINNNVPLYESENTIKIERLNELMYDDYKAFQDTSENKFSSPKTIFEIQLVAYNNEVKNLQKKIIDILKKVDKPSVTIAESEEAKNKIDKINGEIVGVKQKLKALIDANYLRSQNYVFLGFGKKLSNGYYNLMYSNNGENLHFLTDAGVNFGSNSGAVYSELASGVLGVFRLSVGTMVANSSEENKEEEIQDEAYQRLASNGGNTVLKVEYPLVYWCAEDNQYNFIGRFLGKAAADFPAFGTKTDDFSGSVSGGVDFYVDGSTTNGEIRLYSNFNISTYKSSEQFKENLGIEKTEFTFGTISAGLIISNKVNLSVIFNTFSSEKNLRNRNVVIGGSLLL